MWNLFKVNYNDNRKAATDVIKFEEVNSGWDQLYQNIYTESCFSYNNPVPLTSDVDKNLMHTFLKKHAVESTGLLKYVWYASKYIIDH